MRLPRLTVGGLDRLACLYLDGFGRRIVYVFRFESQKVTLTEHDISAAPLFEEPRLLVEPAFVQELVVVHIYY